MKKLAKWMAAGAFSMAAAAWGAPDLVVSSVTLDKNKAYPGEKITIDSVTRNNGDATGWWKYCDVYYYWGTAGNLKAKKIGSGATPNYNEVNGIDKGEEEADTLGWTIPEGTAPGIYYVTCVADAEGEIAESNEGNNSKSVKFTVIGTPSFSGLKWGEPKYVSGGDPATIYGECANIAKGTFVTVQIYEDDLAGDDLMATVYPQVREAGDGTMYFTKSWTAVHTNDASGDPEYYFKVSYTQDGKTYTADSGQNDGAFLHVSQDRMTPSYAASKNDFYYDNASTNDPGFRGASSGTVKLTDDRIPLILVHGMGGDGKPNTLNYWYGWMNADPDYPLGYFNQAPMSSMFRVYRYVYDTRDFISTNGVRFANFVNNWYARHPEFEGRQVVVMAHSMGGLVSRYAMNVNTQFAAKVHRLVTLGSPHLGAQGANPTWIKYAGPGDNSWFISSVYNTFDLHDNTAGCFDLAWHSTNEIPAAALTTAAINEMGDSYNTALLTRSLRTPFAGTNGMRSTLADNKCVLFGGSATNKIGDNLRPSWNKAAADEVSSDHLGLWVATKIYRSMSYADGTGVGDNDGLVPLISALMSDTLKCARADDRNRHPTAAKFNLNAMDGQQVDHASYLDVPVTMDAVKAVLLTQVRGYCQPADAVSAGAAWRLVDNVTGETSPWQRTGVRLPALVPGRSYTVNFKEVSNFATPKNVTFTATKAVTKAVTGTYVTGGGNHPPTGLALDKASVEENAPEGTAVGTLGAHDEDGDSLTYALVPGDGDTDNACFRIVGNQLQTAREFDFETAAKHYCRVRASDGTGAWTEEAFAIDVIDVDETTPAQATGPAWLALSWDEVPGATDYRVDVSAGTKSTVYTVPKASLGTNQFLAGQVWRYEAPEGATTTAQGSVKTSPCWFKYGTTNAHALFGTNGMALVTAELPLQGASAATIDFTHGNWNGGGDTNISRIDAYYRIDGGEWQPVGSSVATAPKDGGEVSFWQDDFIEPPEGALTIEFKLEAPNAWRNDWQRGPYVTDATVTLYGQGDFADADVHLAGFPEWMNVTGCQVQRLPADTTYWYHIEALVDGAWVDVAYGSKKTEDTVPAPTGLRAESTNSTSLTATWTDPGQVDHFEVQLTPVIASGTPRDIATVPNVNLSGSANTGGWRYSANHAVVQANWICATTNTDWDYHGLVVKTLPGVQSPALDLSGCESASLRFVARTRGVDNGVEGKPMVLYYKLPGGDWTEAGSATTNTIYINNNHYIHFDLPAEALADGVKLELGVPGATGTNGVWYGEGDGVRNVTLQGVPKPAPDYGAETALALGDVPSPLANPVEPWPEAAATAVGLAMGTEYWVHVRSVDAWGHVSAWVEASAATLAASAPTGLSLSSRSVRENNAVGEYIGQLSAVDADADDEVSYELAEGEGSEGNALVEIRGATLRAAGVFRAGDGATRRVRVRATDAQGLWTEAVFELSVVPDAAPVATGELIDPATFAAMVAANRGVRFTSAGGDAETGELRATWEDTGGRPDGARGMPKYDVYVSTNLAAGFAFRERVTATEWSMPRNEGAPAMFWVVLVAE